MTGTAKLRIVPSQLGGLPLFTTAQARDAGLSGHDLAILVRRQLIWRPAQGWYSCRPDATEDERHVLRAVATLNLHGEGAVACRATAVLLHGMPLAKCDLSTVEIAKVGMGHGRTRSGVRVSEFAAKGVDCVVVGVPLADTSVRVVDPATAIVGTAVSNNPLAAVVAADHALRHGLCTGEDVRAALGARAGSKGVAAARQALEYLEPRHESPGETLTAAILRLGPWAFEPQVEVIARGRLYRLDFALSDYRVAIEFDGQIKYTGPEVMQSQLAREADLVAEGWIVVRFTWADLEDEFAMISRVRDAVAAARAAA